MASTELISSVGKPKKKLTFGQQLGDVGRLYADTMLSTLGASDVISNDSYKTDWAQGASDILSPIAEIGGQIALAAATGGAANAVLGVAKAGPKVFATGGLLTKFNGPTHERGGIKLGQDEVEGGESMMPMDSQSDFIFSDRIMVPGTKKTFADKSKRIESKYKLRPNDSYSKKAQERELKQLANEQEFIKTKATMDAVSTHFKNGGMRYANGGEWDVPTYQDWMIQQDSQVPTLFDKPQSFLDTSYRNDNRSMPITKLTPKTITKVNPVLEPFKAPNLSGVSNTPNTYSSDFTLPALGYAAQALTNIPALLTKPDEINSPRVKFDRLNMAEQRNEARRARNLGLATARNVGATDAGQMMNYLSGTTAALNSVYGNQFNQSLLQEQQANAEIAMREQLANSEIGRYDEQINAQERDAARALRMNALQNLGAIAAGAGRDYMAMQENDAMMNVLMGSNPDYTYDVNTPTGRMKWLKSKTLTPKRRKV